MTTATAAQRPAALRWQSLVAPYQHADTRRSLLQVAATLVPYFVLWYVMYRSLEISYWLTLLLAIPTAGFAVRTFILFHDAGHGALFKAHRLNDVVGIITGIISFTPYYYWKHEHAIHHATAGNLDRRGTGDILTLTVEDYRALPPLRKFGYRIMRNPLILFTIGSFLVFTVFNRFGGANRGKRERYSVIWTNLALVAIVTGLSLLVGWKEFLLVQFPIAFLASSVGVWMFYVQHNFDGVYWERDDNWDYYKAGIAGSSFYKLPALIEWFTGNIGYHHIHHLSPRIPFYHLPECYRNNPAFHIHPMGFRESLRCMTFRLYDERAHHLAGWEALRAAAEGR